MLRAVTGLIEEHDFWSSLGSIACMHEGAPISIPSREGLTQEVPYRIEGLNVSVSREARVGRSGDSARKRRVASLSQPVAQVIPSKFCRETRRARRQQRAHAEPQPDSNQTICLSTFFQLSIYVAIRPSISS